MPKKPSTATATTHAPGEAVDFSLQLRDDDGDLSQEYAAALPVEWQNKLWDSFVSQIKATVKAFKKGGEQPTFTLSS
ncbi:MAG: hypothetical protein SF069_03055 [Phycisphaerae bacterium]|nr:hypothetical protein [Phycisphaerae bacterium]